MPMDRGAIVFEPVGHLNFDLVSPTSLNPRARVFPVEHLTTDVFESVGVQLFLAYFQFIGTNYAHWCELLIVGRNIELLALGSSEPAPSVLGS